MSAVPSTRSLARVWVGRISLAAVAPVSEFAGRFLRTILLSRLLLPAEFGTAVALAVVVATAQMVSDIGLDRFVLLKSPAEGDSSLATAHTLQAVRGVVVAALMAASGWPVAQLFGIPNAAPIFTLAAIIPLVRSFAHLGAKQAQREYQFRIDAVSTFVASVVSLLVAFIGACWLQDASAMLLSLVGAEIAYVAATHILCIRAFEMAFDPQAARQILRYGLPLTLNGVGIAMFAQADRLLVGAAFGVETLGKYAVIVSLAIVTMSPFYSICSSIGVSILARNRENIGRFVSAVRNVTWFFGLFAIVYASLVGLGLDLMVPVVFGDRYAVPPGVQVVLSTIVFVRIMRGPPSTLLLVDGKTMRLTIANLASGIGLVAAFLMMQQNRTLEGVLWGVFVGDAISLVLFQVFFLRGMRRLDKHLFTVPAIQLVIGLALWAALFFQMHTATIARLSMAVACLLVAAWMVVRCTFSRQSAEIL